MFSLEVLLMACVIVFCVGGLLGAFISRSIFPPEQQKILEESLSSSRKELDHYQREVAQHFADTAELVQNLTKSYKDVHDHLAKGAVNLTNAEITQQILKAGDDSIGIDAKESLGEHTLEVPRDWAPKSPGQTGTLSEEYGLNDIEHNDSTHSDAPAQKIS